MNIKNCQFIGTKWDENAIEAVKIVAEGLLNLTALFIGQNIKIESLLTVVGEDKTKPTKNNFKKVKKGKK